MLRLIGYIDAGDERPKMSSRFKLCHQKSSPTSLHFQLPKTFGKGATEINQFDTVCQLVSEYFQFE